jgi:hypothetical protein
MAAVAQPVSRIDTSPTPVSEVSPEARQAIIQRTIALAKE